MINRKFPEASPTPEITPAKDYKGQKTTPSIFHTLLIN
jgi:hypothetical protein